MRDGGAETLAIIVAGLPLRAGADA